MEMSGAQSIAADRNTVWAALNDPETLKACIPGCESLEATGENQYAIVMMAAVGPVKAKFKAKLELSDIVPAESYTMTFDGSGGAAGFGKGKAGVKLEDQDGGTQLNYTAQAQVGGKIAQVGARLIDGVAKKMADEFFTRFKAKVEGPVADSDAAAEAAPGDEATGQSARSPSATAATPASAAPARKPAASAQQAASGGGKASPVIWAAVLAACVIAAYFIFAN